MKALFPAFEKAASIDLSDIRVSRGNNPLFDAMSLHIAPGDIVYVQGRNGIGKTSLLRLIAGFARADSGAIGWVWGQTSCQPAQIVVYQGHSDAFKPTLKAIEELRFWADLNGFKSDLLQVFEFVGLDDKAGLETAKLSAGQKRRLAMARLIVSQKPIWILDEPAAVMDKAGAALIDDIITRHTARGGSVILASHAQARSLSKNTRRLLMDDAA